MNEDEFVGWLLGILTAVLVVFFMFAVLGHETYDSVRNIPSVDVYRVVVDDAEFVCQRAPRVGAKQVVLFKCDGMPSNEVRINNVDTVTFTYERDE